MSKENTYNDYLDDRRWGMLAKEISNLQGTLKKIDIVGFIKCGESLKKDIAKLRSKELLQRIQKLERTTQTLVTLEKKRRAGVDRRAQFLRNEISNWKTKYKELRKYTDEIEKEEGFEPRRKG